MDTTQDSQLRKRLEQIGQRMRAISTSGTRTSWSDLQALIDEFTETQEALAREIVRVGEEAEQQGMQVVWPEWSKEFRS